MKVFLRHSVNFPGFSAEQDQSVAGGMRGVLPRAFRIIGPSVDNHSARSGAQKMQVCDLHLLRI